MRGRLQEEKVSSESLAVRFLLGCSVFKISLGFCKGAEG